jgi:hypothetical protein
VVAADGITYEKEVITDWLYRCGKHTAPQPHAGLSRTHLGSFSERALLRVGTPNHPLPPLPSHTHTLVLLRLLSSK